jgi:pheromone shutdown protein TraB
VAARVASEAVGAQIVLGDRPIEITLERAWDALPLRRRLQLCWELVLAGTACGPAGGSGGGSSGQVLGGGDSNEL